MAASNWDQRYLEGSDRWELGKPAPPLETFLRTDSRASQPPCRVLVPGCGLGHEAALLADLGYEATGLDFSGEEIQRTQALQRSDRTALPCAGYWACWSTSASAPLIQTSAEPISTPRGGCSPPVAGCLVCSGATGGRIRPGALGAGAGNSPRARQRVAGGALAQICWPLSTKFRVKSSDRQSRRY